MILSSRPLRFLAMVFVGWTGVRAYWLWPQQIAPVRLHAPSVVVAATPPAGMPVLRTAEWRRFAAMPARFALRANHGLVRPPATAAHWSSSAPPFRLESAPLAFDLSLPDPIPPGADPPPMFLASRWSGSAWAILRPDGRATPFASQLGGSQAGARIAYALGEARRVALYARASSAIDAVEREAAVGIDWRPTRLPIHLIAERRIGIEGVRSGTAVGAVGGVGPTPVVGPVRAEGYAQAGVIFRNRREGFADGSLRFTLPVRTRLDLGLGIWGGAQQGAARLDVGPTIGVAIPVAGGTVRLAADWRQRVAGNARPGSGPAVSLGVDF